MRCRRGWWAAVASIAIACGSSEDAVEPVAPRVEAEQRREEPASEPPSEPPSASAPDGTAEPALGPCEADADCVPEGSCTPERCVLAPVQPPTCTGASQLPGTCACVEGRCALRPRDEVRSDEECESFGPRACGLDLARGLCAPGIEDDPPPEGPRWIGPRCYCDGRPPRQCHLAWIEPVACTSTDDCWVELTPVPHPIARPRRMRGRRFRPCRDGELAPACEAGRCTLVGFSC